MEIQSESFVLYDIIGVVVCIILSAFFSGTETALTALTHPKIHNLMEKNSINSAILKKWLEQPGMILATILIGNNLVNILASILGSRIAHHYLKNYADAAAVAVLTLIVLMFGEVTPKTCAKINPERFASFSLIFLKIVDFILYPLSLIISKSVQGALILFGGNERVENVITQHEIEFLIKKGSDMGVFEEEDQGDLLTSVLEFKDTTVEEVMIPRIDTHFLSNDTKIKEAVEKVSEWGNSRIPVYSETIDNIVGILYTKDLVKLLKNKNINLEANIAGIIRKKILFVPETQKINETLDIMQKKRTHLAIVVDEFGGTAGIITLEDIIEELVGDIMDEDDKEENTISKLVDNTLSVDAHISISDLEEELDIALPEDGEYNSLGGFLIKQAGEVPKEGYIFKYAGHEFKVVESDERHISRVEIKKIEIEETSEN